MWPPIPSQHREVTHFYSKSLALFNKLVLIVIKFCFFNISNPLKIIFKALTTFIVVSPNKEFSSFQTLKNLFCSFFVTKAKVTKNIYKVFFLNSLVP